VVVAVVVVLFIIGIIGAAVGREHGFVTPDGACTSNVESGLVFEGRPRRR